VEEIDVGTFPEFPCVSVQNLQKTDKMPKLTETFARKVPQTKNGTDKHWDSEIKGLVLFVGKRSKTWYFQKDVGGQTKRIMIGRFPVISAQAARQTAMELALEMGRGAGKVLRLGRRPWRRLWKVTWRGRNCGQLHTNGRCACSSIFT